MCGGGRQRFVGAVLGAGSEDVDRPRVQRRVAPRSELDGQRLVDEVVHEAQATRAVGDRGDELRLDRAVKRAGSKSTSSQRCSTV
jgi:hypothetical protein